MFADFIPFLVILLTTILCFTQQTKLTFWFSGLSLILILVWALYHESHDISLLKAYSR
jgi:hypothetical protein